MDLKKLMNQSFLTRTISGAVLVLLLLITGLVGNDLLYVFTMILAYIGVYEMLGVLDLKKSILGSTAYLGIFVYYFMIHRTQAEYLSVFLIGYLIVILAIYVFTYPRFKTEEVLMGYFAVVYVAVLLSFVYLVRMEADGNVMIWLIFLCSWGCDTCAYLTGVTCGKHKMAPVLSPKKSIEGAIGGIVGAMLLGALYGFLLQDSIYSLEHPALMCAVICGIGGCISMIGDLAASAVKRNYGIKDYGKLIPGHGGVMDRFDSVIYTAPVIYFLVTFLG